jgi:predicted nucleotidyltransferase
MSALMKHTLSELRDLPVEADVDEARKEVTLHVAHLDSSLIVDFVCRVLPDQGIVAYQDDSEKDSTWRTPAAPYALFVRLFGDLHHAQVVQLASISGSATKTTLVLEDPTEERKRRCLETAADVLRALHERGVEARVVGSVARDGPWHRGTDVDVMVMNRQVPGLTLQDPDVRAVVASRQWRAPLDVFYACWWAALTETEPFLAWSPAQNRCIPATWSDSEKKFVASGDKA